VALDDPREAEREDAERGAEHRDDLAALVVGLAQRVERAARRGGGRAVGARGAVYFRVVDRRESTHSFTLSWRQGMAALYHRARVMTCAGSGADPLGIITDGAVLTEGGRVVWVGPD